MVPSGLDLTQEQILALLSKGRMELVGHFVNGSNYTFLATLDDGTTQIEAVYKPVKGENPLWDFPNRTLAKRETAAYILSEWLGWNFVPPTVFRKDGLLGAGSLQIYIDHDPEQHYFSLRPTEIRQLRRVALFDLVINNADRKGSHLIFDSQHRLWLIDHGLCFNTEDKLRTVIWNFAGEAIPEDLLAELRRARNALPRDAELFTLLHPYITIAEIKALEKRVSHLIAVPVFPFPPVDRRSYPYPPL